jgi:hypothetical protein
MFAGIYYSLQRLLKARMFSDFWVNFWGWQLIIVAAAISLPLGYSSSKEYAELESNRYRIALFGLFWYQYDWNYYKKSAICMLQSGFTWRHSLRLQFCIFSIVYHYRFLEWKVIPFTQVQDGNGGTVIMRLHFLDYTFLRIDVLFCSKSGKPSGIFL